MSHREEILPKSESQIDEKDSSSGYDVAAIATPLDKEHGGVGPSVQTFDYPDGGVLGWLCVFGSWLVLFTTLGYAQAFGVYQDYYQLVGYPNHSASAISWIGSVQLFFQFGLGAISGPLYDKGYFYHLMWLGSAFYVFCLFMVSLCKEFWQVILAQAFGMGIASGIILLPALSIVSQYFLRRRALAIGTAVTGASVAGICFPIMLNRLIASHGFPSAVRSSGYVVLASLVTACVCMHPTLPRSHQVVRQPVTLLWKWFASPSFSLLVTGLYLVTWGIWFPIFYLQVFAQTHNISKNLVTYTLAIYSAASVCGRTLPNFLADRFGSINLLAITSTVSGSLCFALRGATSDSALIVFAIIFGIFSGANASLLSPALISFAQNPSEVGLRMGVGLVIISVAALTGTPITGALVDRYGYMAAIGWSGACILGGAVCFVLAVILESRVRGTRRL